MVRRWNKYKPAMPSVSFVLLAVALAVAGCGKERSSGASDVASDHVRSSQNDVPPGGYVAMSTPNVTASEGKARGLPTPGVNLGLNQRLADAVTTMGGVSAATVLTMGDSAYAAVILTHQMPTDNGRLHPADASEAQKNDIAKLIQSRDPSIKRVYVSANPDFVQRIGALATDINAGKPVSGLIEQLSTVVERVFPQRSGAANPPPPRPGSGS